MHSELHISQADRRPMYLQIMEQIRHRIAIGDWPPGSEIPSIRALAAATKVSVITVKRAFDDLLAEGVLVTRQGKGTFVADHVDLKATPRLDELDAHLRAAASLAMQMGLGEEELTERWQQALETGQGNKEPDKEPSKRSGTESSKEPGKEFSRESSKEPGKEFSQESNEQPDKERSKA